MPIYEYICTKCHYRDEVLQKMTDPKQIECPACHAMKFERQISPAGFQLKGSGWYVTDFKDKPAKKTETNTQTSDGANQTSTE